VGAARKKTPKSAASRTRAYRARLRAKLGLLHRRVGRPRLYRDSNARQRAYYRRKKARQKQERLVLSPYNLAKSHILFSSRSDDWETPQNFFDKLNSEFGFQVDAAASPDNAKCAVFFTKQMNGLAQEWSGKVVFVNPPYGKQMSKWMQKAFESSLAGATVVCLVHSRTDTRWWFEWVQGKAEVRFVRGRLKFGDGKQSAPFPSAVVIYRPPQTEAEAEVA
jgi:phage N-6-adenine-methyltransferase